MAGSSKVPRWLLAVALVGALFIGGVVGAVVQYGVGQASREACTEAYVKCRRFCLWRSEDGDPARKPSEGGPCEWPVSKRGNLGHPFIVQPTEPNWFEICTTECGHDAVRCMYGDPCEPFSLEGVRFM